jgi:hypothetical protein
MIYTHWDLAQLIEELSCQSASQVSVMSGCTQYGALRLELQKLEQTSSTWF